MKNFLNIRIPRKFKKLSEKEMMAWFELNNSKIFSAGDINILDQYVEWVYDNGNSVVRINWKEIIKLYVSAESDAKSIYIESDKNQIKFYVNNKDKTRDQFLNYLRKFAISKGADLRS